MCRQPAPALLISSSCRGPGKSPAFPAGWARSWGGIAQNPARLWAFSFIASISGLCSACLLWQQEKLEMSKGRVNKLRWHKFQWMCGS